MWCNTRSLYPCLSLLPSHLSVAHAHPLSLFRSLARVYTLSCSDPLFRRFVIIAFVYCIMWGTRVWHSVMCGTHWCVAFIDACQSCVALIDVWHSLMCGTHCIRCGTHVQGMPLHIWPNTLHSCTRKDVYECLCVWTSVWELTHYTHVHEKTTLTLRVHACVTSVLCIWVFVRVYVCVRERVCTCACVRLCGLVHECVTSLGAHESRHTCAILNCTE